MRERVHIGSCCAPGHRPGQGPVPAPSAVPGGWSPPSSPRSLKLKMSPPWVNEGRQVTAASREEEGPVSVRSLQVPGKLATNQPMGTRSPLSISGRDSYFPKPMSLVDVLETASVGRGRGDGGVEASFSVSRSGREGALRLRSTPAPRLARERTASCLPASPFPLPKQGCPPSATAVELAARRLPFPGGSQASHHGVPPPPQIRFLLEMKFGAGSTYFSTIFAG